MRIAHERAYEIAKLLKKAEIAKHIRQKSTKFDKKAQKMTFFYIFSLKNLVISKKSSNFAPAFGKEASKKDANFIVSLAQLVEQLTLNQWVESSSLSGDTNEKVLKNV